MVSITKSGRPTVCQKLNMSPAELVEKVEQMVRDDPAMSREDAAAAIGVSRSTYYRYVHEVTDKMPTITVPSDEAAIHASQQTRKLIIFALRDEVINHLTGEKEMTPASLCKVYKLLGIAIPDDDEGDEDTALDFLRSLGIKAERQDILRGRKKPSTVVIEGG